MKKVVINKCYGGYSLSPAAVRRLAELHGRPCYFFEDGRGIGKSYKPVEEPTGMFWTAFDIPNPEEILLRDDGWASMSQEQKNAVNKSYSDHVLDNRPDNRSDPLLIQVVEKLGEKANGSCAELKVVEIPDDVEYTIEEYDGLEHVAEVHQTWG